MFVSIDMDKLVFLHKHHDHDTLSALSFLEAPDRSIRVESTDHETFLRGFGYVDLCMLYKNTTGATFVHQQPHVLRLQLGEVVRGLEARLALLEEVQAQVEAVEADLHKGIAYSYVLGAKVPGVAQELFPVTGKPLSPPKLDAIAASAPAPVSAPAPAPAAPTTPEPAAPTVRTAKVSVEPVARAAADRAWDAAGRPTDSDGLAAVKSTATTELLAQGYHPTTVRIKLSKWVKEKLA